MKLTTVTLDYVNDLGEVSGVCVYGVGLITSLFYGICTLFGKSSVFLGRKLDRAKEKATEEMKLYAEERGADGVMNIRYQLSGLTVLVYGTAYSYPAEPALDNLPQEAFALAEPEQTTAIEEAAAGAPAEDAEPVLEDAEAEAAPEEPSLQDEAAE